MFVFYATEELSRSIARVPWPNSIEAAMQSAVVFGCVGTCKAERKVVQPSVGLRNGFASWGDVCLRRDLTMYER